MGAGLRPEAKATESPPDPNVGAPVLDSTIRPQSRVPEGQELESGEIRIYDENAVAGVADLVAYECRRVRRSTMEPVLIVIFRCLPTCPATLGRSKTGDNVGVRPRFAQSEPASIFDFNDIVAVPAAFAATGRDVYTLSAAGQPHSDIDGPCKGKRFVPAQ